jgi:hypothetical protein
MSWRRMGEWRYISIFLDLGTRWVWVVSFTPLPLYPPGVTAFSTHCIGGWVGSWVGLDVLSLPGSESGPSSPSLYRLSFDLSMYPINHCTDSVEIRYGGPLHVSLLHCGAGLYPFPFCCLIRTRIANNAAQGRQVLLFNFMPLRAPKFQKSTALWVVTPCSSVGFLLGLLFDLKHGGDKFLWNVGLFANYTA